MVEDTVDNPGRSEGLSLVLVNPSFVTISPIPLDQLNLITTLHHFTTKTQ